MLARRKWSLHISRPPILFQLSPQLQALCELDRHAVASGELWRLVTGHWTHGSTAHFAWDLLAFVGLGWACEELEIVGRRRFLVALALAACAIPLALAVGLPDLQTYRGLSGLDSALFGLLWSRPNFRQLSKGEPLQCAVPLDPGAPFTASAYSGWAARYPSAERRWAASREAR